MGKCIECKHFKIIQQPIKDKSVCWDLGRAVCDKYELHVDFRTQGKLKKMECVEDDEITYAQVRGDNNGND